MTSYNEARALDYTIRAYANQIGDPGSFELVIVDDGSTDDTSQVVDRLGSLCRIRYVQQSNRGRSAARNIGIREATGDVLIFADADAVPGPEFVAAHRRHHERADNAVVLGLKYETLAYWKRGMAPEFLLHLMSCDLPDELRDKARRAARGQEVEFLSVADVERGLRNFDVCTVYAYQDEFERIGVSMATTRIPWILVTTRNLSIHRGLLDRAGEPHGFDESFRGWGMEDTELAYRLWRAGGRFVFAAQAANYHLYHRTARGYADAFRKCAGNYRRFLTKYPTYEVFLFWRYLCELLSVKAYHELVESHAQWVADAARAPAADDEQVIALRDYERLCKFLAHQYCSVDDPEPVTVARSSYRHIGLGVGTCACQPPNRER